MNEQVNGEYILQSLQNQIARLSYQVAERDAIITEQQQEIQKLQQAQIDEIEKENESKEEAE